MRFKKQNGLSLIVLVVTILVLSILATVIIISLSNTNIIKQTQNTKKAADIANLKEVANFIYADLYLEKGENVTAEDIIKRLKEQGYTDEQLNLISISVTNGKAEIRSKGVYGVRREVGSTSTSWERIEDSVGLVANACKGTVTDVQNDFDSIYPWSDIVSYNWDATTETVTAVYGDSNYKTDGTNGDVLTKIPEFYYKREQKTENDKVYEYIYISEEDRAGYSKSEEFSIGRYLSSFNDDGNLMSVSNANVATDKSLIDFRVLAENTNYTLLDYRYFALQLLYLVEYANYNSQLKLGNGNVYYRYSQTKQEDGTYIVTDKAILSATNSNTITIALVNTNKYKVGQQIDIGISRLGVREKTTETYRTITAIREYNVDGVIAGQTITFDGEPINIVSGSHGIWSCAQNTGSADALGMKSGYVGQNGYSAVLYRGVEDFFGNAFQFVDGINIKRASDNADKGEIYVSYVPPYTSNKIDGEYIKIGYQVPLNTYAYVSMLGYDESNPLISITTATASAYSESIKDVYVSSSKEDAAAAVGGTFSNGEGCGAFFWSLNYRASYGALYLACRILK